MWTCRQPSMSILAALYMPGHPCVQVRERVWYERSSCLQVVQTPEQSPLWWESHAQGSCSGDRVHEMPCACCKSRLPHHGIINRSSSRGRKRRCWSWDRGSRAEALTGLSKNVLRQTYPHTSSWTSRTHIPSGIHNDRIQANCGTAGPLHIYEHHSDTRPHLCETYGYKKWQ